SREGAQLVAAAQAAAAAGAESVAGRPARRARVEVVRPARLRRGSPEPAGPSARPASVAAEEAAEEAAERVRLAARGWAEAARLAAAAGAAPHPATAVVAEGEAPPRSAAGAAA